MVKPIPDNVKACLGELSASQQVTLRGYIGTLRAELKGLEEQIRTLEDPDPHAHYHGHDKVRCAKIVWSRVWVRSDYCLGQRQIISSFVFCSPLH